MIPRPHDCAFRRLQRVLVCFIGGVGAWSFFGCARMTQTLTTKITQTNGVVEERSSKVSGMAFWDAKQTLEKLRVSNGKTHSIGLTGAEQESATTNMAASLDALTRLLQTIRP